MKNQKTFVIGLVTLCVANSVQAYAADPYMPMPRMQPQQMMQPPMPPQMPPQQMPPQAYPPGTPGQVQYTQYAQPGMPNYQQQAQAPYQRPNYYQQSNVPAAYQQMQQQQMQQMQPPMPQQPMPQGYPSYNPNVMNGNMAPPPSAQAIPSMVGPVYQDRTFTYRPEGIMNNAGTQWTIAGLAIAAGIGGTLALSGVFDGDDTSSSGSSRENLRDDEFNAQYGLDRVKADYAFDRGFTGNGVIVAQLDSGIDLSHSEFQGRIADGAYDFVTDQAGMPDAADLDAHGTETGGVIVANRNGAGMEGLAYNAKIVPIRVLDGDGSGTSADVIQGAEYAATLNGVTAVNVSLGPSDAAVAAYETAGHQIYTSTTLLVSDAYKAITDSGKILVVSTGNSYQDAPGIASNPIGAGFLPFIKPANANVTGAENGAYRDSVGGVMASADYSGMQPLTLAVGAVDQNNTITAFSNRCGVAKDWCLVAPGYQIFTTTVGGGYTTVSGTSFAAPHVAAAAALLKQAFPSLSNEEIVEILLETATDLGDDGVDAVYGHGLLNVDAATRPLGTTSIITGSNINGQRVNLNSSAMRYGAAFGANAAAGLADQRIAFIDKYNRGYSTSLSNMVNVRADNLNVLTAFNDFDNPNAREDYRINDSMKVSLQFSSTNDNDSKLTSSKPREEKANDKQLDFLSLNETVSNDTAVSLHYNDAESMSLGFREADRSKNDRVLNKDALKNPYAALANDSYTAAMTTKGLGGTIRVAGYFGDSGEGMRTTDSTANFGSQVDATYGLGENSEVVLGIGSLFEEGGMLGSRGEGAFALQGGATMYSGVGTRLSLDGDTVIRTTAYAGWTSPSLDQNSLIKDASDFISTAFNADIERKHVAQQGDSLSFGVAQPLRVENGSMQFSIPVARDATSSTVYSNGFTQNLAASGREIDVGVSYAFPIEDNTRLSLGALYRHDAGHVSGNADQLGVVRWQRRF